jgi:hypothetical protein
LVGGLPSFVARNGKDRDRHDGLQVGTTCLCEEQHLQFTWQGSLQQCAMAAQLYIAQWIGEHPQWTVRNYRCEYPGLHDRANMGGAASRI